MLRGKVGLSTATNPWWQMEVLFRSLCMRRADVDLSYDFLWFDDWCSTKQNLKQRPVHADSAACKKLKKQWNSRLSPPALASGHRPQWGTDLPLCASGWGDGTLPWTVPRCKMDRSRSLKESTQSNRQEDHGRSFKQKLFTEVRQRMTERTTFLTTRTYPNYEKYRTVASCNCRRCVFNQVWLKVHLFRDTSWISCYYEVEPVRRDQKEEFEIHCNLKILVFNAA